MTCKSEEVFPQRATLPSAGRGAPTLDLFCYCICCIIFLKISCSVGLSFIIFFITCMLCVFSKSYAILFMIILNFVFLENSLQSWTKLLRKLHSWGAFFLNFVADRFFPSPLPLEAVLLGLQKKAGSLSICRKQLWTGGGGFLYAKPFIWK